MSESLLHNKINMNTKNEHMYQQIYNMKTIQH